MLNQQDTISAKEGSVFMTVGGETLELAEVKTFLAEVELTIADVQSVGQRMLGSKVVGAEGTGEMTYHYQNPRVRRIFYNYVKNGIMPQISVKVTNADLTSQAGRQTVLVKGIVFETAKIAEIDATSDDILEDETSFRFNDFELLEEFKSL